MMPFRGRPIDLIDRLTDIVWVQTAFLGDLVITTGAMSVLRDANPAIRQHLVTTPVGSAAFRGRPWLASVHVLEKRSGGALRNLRDVAASVRAALPRGANAVTLQPHKSLRSTLVSRLIGVPSVTYHETALSVLADRRVDRVAVFHEASRIAMLAEALGIPREAALRARLWMPPNPVLNPEWAESFERITRGRSLVAVAPGSVWGTKRWPVESFAALARRVLQSTKVAICLIGGREERPLADEVERFCDPDFADRVINLAGRTSLDDLRALYPRFKLLVSNDSSSIHYASAFQVPTIAIFGATIPQMGFGPLADDSVALGVEGLSCRPCGAHGPQVCPLGHFRCMKGLSVESVVAEVSKRLAGEWSGSTSHLVP